MRVILLAGLVPAVVLACGEPSLDTPQDTRRPSTQVLRDIPVPPTAQALGLSGNPNSLEVSLTETASADSVAAFYRAQLIADGWDLRVDSRLPGGGINLHAVRDGRPVWVMIYPREPSGSRFNVIAGVPDSTTR